MGYEIKLYLVQVPGARILDNKKKDEWRLEVASFNLGKPGYDSAIFKLHREAPKGGRYIYADDGNTEIHLDRYDEPLSVMAPIEVVEALKKDCSEGWSWLRAEIALGGLSAVLSGGLEYEVLGYGY